ncbi:MAG: hypothetical protein PHY56_00305 [Candidatus Omnitrophica bacterium]|nr:hypothetical protein [Candidatus Omnitrophota bacterium]
MEPLSWLMLALAGTQAAIGGIGSAVVSGKKQLLTAAQASAEETGLRKQQAIEDVQDQYATEDINMQYNKQKEVAPDIAFNKGLVNSGIYERELKDLSDSLARTLNRKSTLFGMRRGYQNWALDTNKQLKAMATDIDETAAGWGIAGDIAGAGMSTVGYIDSRQQMDKLDKLLSQGA